MRRIVFLLSTIIILVSCSNETSIPDKFTSSDQNLLLFPDYTEVTVPGNIAPLNFNITSHPQKAVVEVKGEKGGVIVASADDKSSIRFNQKQWSSLLETNRGASLSYTIYTFDGSSWKSHPTFRNYIAEEDIDPYISYRLIEPGYVRYSNLGIYQRDLSNFDEKVIYHNENDNHCINCHCYKNGRTDHMILHVRENYGGTIVVNGDDVYKVNTKTDSMFTACMYPQWHPTRNLIASSINKVGQLFYLLSHKKIEVVDMFSDIVVYDVDKNEVFFAVNSPNCLETYPSWSPKGDRLYYSSYDIAKDNDNYLDGNKDDIIAKSYDKIHYDIWSMPFDTTTYTFGKPQMEFNAAELGKSAIHIRVSPDGKWMMFCLSDYGQAIFSGSSDLYLKNLETGEVRPMDVANSDKVESYHSWSTNGRWFAISTRRDDENYTRFYFSYFDKSGQEHKPFEMPQEDPLHGVYLLKSYNVPEFMVEPVKISYDKFKDVIYNDKAKPSTFRSTYQSNIGANGTSTK